MVILLYGPNSYSRLKKMSEIIDAKVRSQNISLDRFDFEDEDEYIRFRSFLSERSMFNPKKIGVLENIFDIKAKKELKQILQDAIIDKETLLIVISDTKPPAGFVFLLEKNEDKLLTNQYFPDLKKGEELRNFIKKEAGSREMVLEREEIISMEEACGSNIWMIVTELDKLALLSKRNIEKGESNDYFRTINLFKAGKTVKDKILNLEILLSVRGDEPAKIFNMLGFGYATTEFVDSLADYDVMIKSGKLEYEEALLDIALR